MFQNYLKLENDVPVRVHFDDLNRVERVIRDPDLGKDKTVESRMFWVDRIDGEPAAKSFSVLSEGLWQQLEPYTQNQRFRDFEFVITRRGAGYQTKYEVEAIPIARQEKKQMIGSEE